MSMNHEPTDTDEVSNEALAKRVEDLEEKVELTLEADDGKTLSFERLLEIGLTRRQAFAALGYVAIGMSSVGAIAKAIGNVEAQSDSSAIYGIDQIGLSDDPVTDLYVENLYNTTDNIEADSISTGEAYIGDVSEENRVFATMGLNRAFSGTINLFPAFLRQNNTLSGRILLADDPKADSRADRFDIVLDTGGDDLAISSFVNQSALSTYGRCKALFNLDLNSGSNIETARVSFGDEGGDGLTLVIDTSQGGASEAEMRAAFHNDAALTDPGPGNGTIVDISSSAAFKVQFWWDGTTFKIGEQYGGFTEWSQIEVPNDVYPTIVWGARIKAGEEASKQLSLSNPLVSVN